jgi:hypothetical protein
VPAEQGQDLAPWRSQDKPFLIAKLHEISDIKFPFMPRDWQLQLAVSLIKGKSVFEAVELKSIGIHTRYEGNLRNWMCMEGRKSKKAVD